MDRIAQSRWTARGCFGDSPGIETKRHSRHPISFRRARVRNSPDERPIMAPFDHSDPVFAGRSALHPAPAPIPAEVIVLDIGGSGRAGAQAPGFGADARFQVIMLRPGPGGLPDLSEVAARIGAAVAAPAAEDRPRERHRFGCAWLDLEAARLTDEAGRDIPVTAMEFNLLKLFARNRGRVLTRDQILEGAHDRPWHPFDRSIDVRISRIRRKVEVNRGSPRRSAPCGGSATSTRDSPASKPEAEFTNSTSIRLKPIVFGGGRIRRSISVGSRRAFRSGCASNAFRVGSAFTERTTMATLDPITAKHSFAMTDPALVSFGASDGVGTPTGWSYLSSRGDDIVGDAYRLTTSRLEIVVEDGGVLASAHRAGDFVL